MELLGSVFKSSDFEEMLPKTQIDGGHLVSGTKDLGNFGRRIRFAGVYNLGRVLALSIMRLAVAK